MWDWRVHQLGIGGLGRCRYDMYYSYEVYQSEVHVIIGAYPALTFVISAVLALVTGSSWGTMSIMFPLILPAAHYADPCNKVLTDDFYEVDYFNNYIIIQTVFYGTISSILAGAVLGDHCSPIRCTSCIHYWHHTT